MRFIQNCFFRLGRLAAQAAQSGRQLFLRGRRLAQRCHCRHKIEGSRILPGYFLVFNTVFRGDTEQLFVLDDDAELIDFLEAENFQQVISKMEESKCRLSSPDCHPQIVSEYRTEKLSPFVKQEVIR